MFTPDDPGFDVAQAPEAPRPRFGPCGEIPQAKKTEYRPHELLIRLRDGAVTSRGYSKEALALFQTLWTNHAVRIETLRTVWAFAKSIRTGDKGAPWQVAFESQPAVPAQPLGMGIPSPHWENKLGDAGWVGVTSSDGISAPTGQYVYTLPIGQLYGGEGAFSLAWAADNDAVWSISDGGALRGVKRGENAFSPVKGDAYRFLAGKFNRHSVLTVTVRNTTEFASPTGLLVHGFAGKFPDGRFPSDPNQSRVAQVEPEQLRLSIRQGPAPNSPPAIHFAAGEPGVPLVDKSPLGPAPYHPDLQEEMRHLYVYFSQDPSEEMLSCLRIAPAILFAERMPLTDFSPTAAATVGTLPGKRVEHGFTAMSSMADDETMTAKEYRTAIDWSQPDPKVSNLAVLDDAYGDRDDHGLQVWSVACECLYKRMPSPQSPTPTSIFCWRVTNGGNLNKSQLNPSLYFDSLKLARDKGTIRVVNLSRGSADWTKMERAEMKAMEESQIVVVAAAGQERRSYMADFPASFPTVLSVGGIQKDGSPWMYANCEYDEDRLRCLDRKDSDCAIDVAAPSVKLEVFYEPGAILNGTSFASPMTAALCSTILDRYPSLTAADVRNVVRTTALPVLPVLRDPNRPNQFARCGAGKIQWSAALKAAKELMDAREASQQTGE